MAKFNLALVSFLVVGCASAFTVPQQHAARTSPIMMTTDTGARDPIKVGVIGCGRIGIVHLGAINKAPGVIPVVVSNPTISKAEEGIFFVVAMHYVYFNLYAFLHNKHVSFQMNLFFSADCRSCQKVWGS